jgi:hypothetical protein
MLIISVTTPMKEVQPETEADLGQDEEEEAIEDKADSPSDDSKTEDNENKS